MTIKTLKRKVINGIKPRRKISKKKRIKNIRKKKIKVSKKRKIKGGVYDNKPHSNKGLSVNVHRSKTFKKKNINKKMSPKKEENIIYKATKNIQIQIKQAYYKNLKKRWLPKNPPTYEEYSSMIDNNMKDICAIPAHFINDDLDKIYGHSFYEGTNIYMDYNSFKHVENILYNSTGRHVVSFLSLFVYSNEEVAKLAPKRKYESHIGKHSMMLFASHGNIYIIDHIERTPIHGKIVFFGSEINIPITYINTSWQEKPNNDCHFLTMKAMIVLGEFIMQQTYKPFTSEYKSDLEMYYEKATGRPKAKYEEIFESIKQAITGAIIPYRIKRGVNPTQSATNEVCARQICDSASTECLFFNVSEINNLGLFLYMPPNNIGIFKDEKIKKQRDLWIENLDMAANLLNPPLLNQLIEQTRELMDYCGF